MDIDPNTWEHFHAVLTKDGRRSDCRGFASPSLERVGSFYLEKGWRGREDDTQVDDDDGSMTVIGESDGESEPSGTVTPTNDFSKMSLGGG